MFDIAALGELLIDFTPCGLSPDGQRLFEQNPGGAPANVLAAAGKLGLSTAFIGKVGEDMHGEFLKRVLIDYGINTEGLIFDRDTFTTLAFVALDDNGERSFSFARKPGADTCLKPEEVNDGIIKNSKILHIGSLSLTDEPARSATLHALSIAKENGVMISYDPNYRAPLWKNERAAIEGMRSVLPYVDVLKLSDEEMVLLADESAPETAAKKLVAGGVKLVAVTLGAEGTLVCNREGSIRVPGYQADIIDTTGAGDSFWGGFLYKLIKSGTRPEQVKLVEAMGFASFANAAASLCVEKRGGIPAMPDLQQVLQRKSE